VEDEDTHMESSDDEIDEAADETEFIAEPATRNRSYGWSDAYDELSDNERDSSERIESLESELADATDEKAESNALLADQDTLLAENEQLLAEKDRKITQLEKRIHELEKEAKTVRDLASQLSALRLGDKSEEEQRPRKKPRNAGVIVCPYHKKGRCQRGVKCTWSHDQEPQPTHEQCSSTLGQK
jgi:hypothetical protein